MADKNNLFVRVSRIRCHEPARSDAGAGQSWIHDGRLCGRRHRSACRAAFNLVTWGGVVSDTYFRRTCFSIRGSVSPASTCTRFVDMNINSAQALGIPESTRRCRRFRRGPARHAAGGIRLPRSEYADPFISQNTNYRSTPATYLRGRHSLKWVADGPPASELLRVAGPGARIR